MCIRDRIIIAQRVSSIEDADQIIVLDDGKIAGVGTSEAVSYTHLVSSAVGYLYACV